MNFFFETAVNALEAFLILEFLAQYFGLRIQAPMRYIGFCIFWIVSTTAITLFSWNESFEILSSLSQILINIIFCMILLKGNIGTKIFISTFTMVGIVLISSFTAFFVGHVTQEEINKIYTRFDLVRITAIFMSKVLFFQITRIILRIKTDSNFLKLDIIPLVVIPIISICSVSILTDIALWYPDSQQMIFYVICLIILLSLLTYYLFIRLSRSSQLKHDYELLNLQYDCAKQNAEDIQNMYENIRSIRHDMKNHLLCIANLLQNHPDNSQQAQDYIQKLLNQQEISQRKVIFSGNESLDAILNTKQIAAHQYGINFDIVIADSLQFMSADDICVLFGNLLDNAISAAGQTDTKQINLNIQPQDTYVSIVLANSVKEDVLTSNPTLKTTKQKKDGHGYGIKNVRKVVQKHHGLIRFYENSGMFISDILLLTIPILD